MAVGAIPWARGPKNNGSFDARAWIATPALYASILPPEPREGSEPA
jgi:hypothetical protein